LNLGWLDDSATKCLGICGTTGDTSQEGTIHARAMQELGGNSSENSIAATNWADEMYRWGMGVPCAAMIARNCACCT
jgi:hypothetical protein